ncbi:MAG: signal peptidase I [Gammaproteobacteria bacterium]|nr:MAG: signal peptidase I [Gammaproteobacteria bacterium]
MDIDFSLVLVILVAVTGLVYLLDIVIFKRLRLAAAGAYRAEVGEANVDEAVLAKKLKEPAWIEYPKSFFSVLFIVLVLRSFLLEPFKIPSGSMIPTLQIGDYILVNKFTYGIRLPVIGTEIVPLNKPQRGDIMVFRFPEKPTVNFIKRVVGLPGDEIRYEGKRIFINGELVPQELVAQLPPNRPEFRIYNESLGALDHKVRVDLGRPLMRPKKWIVPDGHYFVMGDNRDHSHDSRTWGFVPDKYIVGKAFAVWMHMPGWVPSFDHNRFLYE